MNWEAAEYEFRAAASLGSAEAQMYLGAVLGEEGRMDEALAAQRKAVELLPQDAEAHFLWAEVSSRAAICPVRFRSSDRPPSSTPTG